MIGLRRSGIRLVAQFDDFQVIPPKAWEQCKAAIAEMLKQYGFRGSVEDGGGQTEAYERWSKWWADEMAKDAGGK